MSLRLRIEHGQDAGKTWRLAGAGVYLMGRNPDVSMRVLDMRVSKHHCEIQLIEDKDGTSAVLKELGSTHGSQVNGQPVSGEVPIKPGDELRLGMTILRVLSDGKADEDVQPVSGRNVDGDRVRGARTGNGNDGKTKQTLPADHLVGKSLAGYSVERKIGAGGMGGVYVAEQKSLKRKVALKVLSRKFAADSSFVDQFLNEAQAAGALNHPNVVQVYDVGSADGQYFFSMELMAGGSLEDRVKEGNIGWQEALNWFVDSANALIFAQKRDILHRDVKPDNLMLGDDEGAKLCDLGLAKRSEVSDLMDQGIIGTPHFISPEAIRRKPGIDARTDLYSLGCTFFRVFTGRNPYRGKSVKEILLGHLNAPVPHVNDLNKNVPKELDEVVAKLMAKDPDERFQGADELLRALDKVRTQYRLEAHGIKPASRKPMFIGLAVALIAIGIAVYFVTRPKEVYIPPKTEAELEADRKARAHGINGELSAYVSVASSRFTELYEEQLTNQIGKGNNWQMPVWARLVEDYRREATAWEGQVKAWEKALADEQDEEVLGYYRSAVKQLLEATEKARTEAKSIEDEVKERKATQKQREEGRKLALAEAEATFKNLSETIQTHFKKKEFLDVERLLQPDHIDQLVKALLDKKVGRFPLLTYKEDIEPLLDKYLPGDEKKRNRGKELVEKAVRSIVNSVGKALEAAMLELGPKPGHERLDKALAILRPFLESIPKDIPEEIRKQAPRTSAAYNRARSAKLEPAIKNIEDLKEKLTWKELRHDGLAYFKLIKKLWMPRQAGGLYRSFHLQAALQETTQGAGEFKTAEYKAPAQQWVVATEALIALFAHFEKSYPSGWVNLDYSYVDERGKRKKEKIKGVGPGGITWDRETKAYADLGPKKLLDDFFHCWTPDGPQPRLKDYSAQDKHGLALLAELAGDYVKAAALYEAARTAYGDDPKAGIIAEREKRLDLEKQAAEKWLAITDWYRRKDSWATYYEARVGTDDFTKEVREKLIAEGDSLRQELQDIYQPMRYDLQEKAELAGTVWGSSIRNAPHPKVAYAGPLPPEKVLPKPPRKPGGDKPGDKKPDGPDPDKGSDGDDSAKPK